jgi:hypothetical protein
MRVRVEFYADDHGIAIPRRVHFDGRKVDVLETVDRWHGPDYCYIKVKGHDGTVYILRLDETQAEWELTMFQRAQDQGLTA